MPDTQPRQQWQGRATPSAPTTALTSPVHPDSSGVSALQMSNWQCPPRVLLRLCYIFFSQATDTYTHL